jgi:hypothetical protein
LYKDELLQQGAQLDNVDRMVQQGFVKWFRRHISNYTFFVIKCICNYSIFFLQQIENKRKDNPDSVSDGLWALSCGPCLRVKFSAACKMNGVRYSTIDREKFLQTQNSGVMTPGEHNVNIIDFYGVLKEVIELQYNSNLQVRRTVVIFRCDWYNQEGKGKGLQDDGYFKSINVQSLWYKTDPFIFCIHDTSLGKYWQVVQKFQNRNIYDAAEKEEASLEVHQDYYHSDTEHVVQEGDDNMPLHNI